MADRAMAPNSRISGGTQSETIATPSVEHGAEVRGNRAMTDEERARAIAGCFGFDRLSTRLMAETVMKHFAAIRADERENCAQEIEPPNAGAGDSEVDDALYRAAETIRARGSE